MVIAGVVSGVIIGGYVAETWTDIFYWTLLCSLFLTAISFLFSFRNWKKEPMSVLRQAIDDPDPSRRLRSIGEWAAGQRQGKPLGKTIWRYMWAVFSQYLVIVGIAGSFAFLIAGVL